MNRIQIQRKRNNVVRLIRQSNRHKNVLRWSSGESMAHIVKKLLICIHLQELGEEYYTEAIFSDGSGRADIIAADRGICIEVVDSEGEESIIIKQKKYPLPVRIVKASNPFREEDIQ